MVELCIEVARRSRAGDCRCGIHNTVEAIELAKHAEKAGANGLLVVTPYYNKPTQKGLIAHYSAIAKR